MTKPILILTDPEMELTHNVPLTAAGDVDTAMATELCWLQTQLSYMADDEDEKAHLANTLRQKIATVPGWKQEPLAMHETYHIGGQSTQVPYSKVLRMHPDNVTKLEASFLSQCEVKPCHWTLPFANPAHPA